MTTDHTAHSPGDLTGKIALVTGATRGAGRAIARQLAATGAEVYCTGRSTDTSASDYGRQETIEETVRLITSDGGTAHARAVDHLKIDEVEQLIGDIDAAHGRLDILINDIGGGPTSPSTLRCGSTTGSRGCGCSRPGS